MKPELTYFLYNEIPGAHHSWTLAVLAAGRRDADKYMKAVNKGGHFVSEISTPGAKVEASCGAVTARAGEILARKQ